MITFTIFKKNDQISYKVLLAVILVSLHSWIHFRQPKPYMDELFHVPQAQNFCQSIATRTFPRYDRSITTPPGLYIPNALLSTILPSRVICSTRFLRLSSTLMIIPIFVITASIISRLSVRFYPNSNVTSASHPIALAITFIPVSLFYSLLYYTDTPSILYILVAWNFSLSNHSAISALVATIATLTRQTNLVWHFFIVAHAFLDNLLFIEPTATLPTALHSRLLKAIRLSLPHIPSALFYAIFLFLNNGVALGDRDHHKETIHHVTIAYFSLFHTIFYFPIQLASQGLTDTFRSVLRIFHKSVVRTTFIAASAIATALVIATGDYAHPFVLADNRHFIFYVYRRWLRRSTIHRLILVPLYAYAPAAIHMELLQLPAGHALYELAMDILAFLCSSAVLLPNPLLEPRYFLVPNLFLTIRRVARMPPPQAHVLRVHFISFIYLLLTVLLVYVFAERPFVRPIDPHMLNDDSPGRFML